MKLKPYPSYKDSGHDWMELVPTQWAIEKFRYCFKESAEKIEAEIVGQMLSVSGYRGIEIKDYEDENQKRLEQDLIGYRIVRPGQLVVNTMWLNYAGLGVSEYEGHVSPAYRSYWINSDLNKRFIHHLMRSGVYVIGYTKFLTGIRPNSLQMSRDDLMVFPILVPLLSEQERIASFLDRETAKLDTLIAKQEKLIELLQEKRQAIISHAVTKGLNPDAKLKDSGVEWLGEVPEHWEVKPLFSIANKRDESNRGMKESNLLSLSYGRIVNKDIDSNDGLLPESFETYQIIYEGDIVFRLTDLQNDKRSLRTAIVEERGIITSAYVAIRPDGISSRYLNYLLRAYDIQKVFYSMGGGLRQSMKFSDIKRLPIIVPDPQVQNTITIFLDHETSKIDTLVEKAKRSIELAKEHRTALISAAVTGKIDVREAA